MNDRVSPSPGFSTGAVAALLAAVVMLALGFLLGAPIPPQMVADRVTSLIPLDVLSRLLGSLESSAKPLVFAGVVAGQVILGGVVAGLAGRAARRGTRPDRIFAVLVAGTWVVLALIIAPLGRAGLVGRDSSAGAWVAGLSFLAEALTFAGVISLDLTAAGADAGAFDPSRRRLLRWVGFGIPGVLSLLFLGRFGVQLARKSAAAPSIQAGSGRLPPPLTPTGDFYIVSKNFIDPKVALDGWQLKVGGLVGTPRTFTYDELRAMPAVRETTTLECISNEVGGSYISTGEWTGVRLRDLLDSLGIGPGASTVVMHAADGYSDSFPLAAALHPATMLVYDLNGKPLPDEHGFPLRVIVPGIFGMKNVKWLQSIELADHEYFGYWQQQGWSNVATVQTMSRIDMPRSSSTIRAGTMTLIGGVAFAGDRGISEVKFSTDGGKSWGRADLQPPLSSLTWVLWTAPWTPTVPGDYTLTVRAWDGTGAPQTTEANPTLPDGATGLHRIRVKVEAPPAG